MEEDDVPNMSRISWLIAFLPLLAMIAIMLFTQLAVAKRIEGSNTADVVDYKLTADGRYTVYRAIREADGAIELYSVPTNGGTPVRLNRTLALERAVGAYQVSADGRWVVYLAPQDNPDRNELYSVPTTGSAEDIIKLSNTQALRGKVLQFHITPDSRRVAYIVSQITEGTNELYSVAIEGPATASVRLSESVELNSQAFNFQFEPDGQVTDQISQEED